MKYIAIPSKGEPSPRIYAISSSWNYDSHKYYNGCRVGIPPYFKVTGLKDGELMLKTLKEGSHEFNYVRKWVGIVPHGNRQGNTSTQPLDDLIKIDEHSVGSSLPTRIAERRILNNPTASCNVSKKKVIDILSD